MVASDLAELCGSALGADGCHRHPVEVRARRWQQQSDFGRFLDPIADKLVVAAALFMLVAKDRISEVSDLPALVILMREILVSGLREHLAGLHVGVPVSRLAKWKTGLQMVAIGVLLVLPAVAVWAEEGFPLPSRTRTVPLPSERAGESAL